jgi:hypothetical protein
MVMVMAMVMAMVMVDDGWPRSFTGQFDISYTGMTFE